jgi:transposase-like protein
MDTMKKNQKISSKKKTLILAEAAIPGCVISKLAKSYDISKGTIYNWVRKSKNFQAQQTKNTEKPTSLISNSFIELSLVDNKSHKNSTLQKASLVFNNFSFVMEGNIEMASLLKVIEMLEKQSC